MIAVELHEGVTLTIMPAWPIALFVLVLAFIAMLAAGVRQSGRRKIPRSIPPENRGDAGKQG
jgi:uncharacterized protein (DUF58 family)